MDESQKERPVNKFWSNIRAIEQNNDLSMKEADQPNKINIVS